MVSSDVWSTWGQRVAEEGFDAITVMVVDDDEISRKLVTSILGVLGVGRIFTAENGADALSQLGDSDTDIDLIICDISMPEMTGYELIRRIRYGLAPKFKDVPILVLTGNPTEQTVQRARTHKIDGYIEKPPTVDFLRVTIRDVLDL